MASWIEELERRERVVLERLEVLRRQIAELSEQVAEQEEQLSRLAITREMMTAILAGIGQPGGLDVRTAGVVAGSPIGVVTVPPRRPGMDAGVLPVAYRDILEVLADAGSPLRAKSIAAALGLSVEAAKVEGLRSRLKRLVERGWLTEQTPGLFAATEVRAVAGRADHPPAGPLAGLPLESRGSSSLSSGVRPHPNRREEEPGGTV
jgi:hypothetical protein